MKDAVLAFLAEHPDTQADIVISILKQRAERNIRLAINELLTDGTLINNRIGQLKKKDRAAC